MIMDWGMMDPAGSEFCLGDMVEGEFILACDCEEVIDTMHKALLDESDNKFEVRRRMAADKVVEQDIIPLLKVCGDKEIFAKAIRLMVNLTQPYDQCVQSILSVNQCIKNEVTANISSVKHQCTDVDFLKAVATNMKEILSKDTLSDSSCQCLNHCLLLLRNLFHNKPNDGIHTTQTSMDHQCLISSFFINELDQVVMAMLNHKLKENWTIGLAQLLSFMFKDYSSSLLEPDHDDNMSDSSSEDSQGFIEILTPGAKKNASIGGTDQNLSSNFKNKLQLCSACESLSRSSEDDDFFLEFKSTDDGKLEIKLSNCVQHENGCCRESGCGSGVNMDTRNTGNAICSSPSKENSSKSGVNSVNYLGKGHDNKAEECSQKTSLDGEDQASQNSSSCLMDFDILIAYLKRFASDMMGAGFVGLVEDIMKVILTKYDNILDHSYLMWTVGFFLSFAHQQDLDFHTFKDILNLDLFGFLVYEAVVCCEAFLIKQKRGQDSSVEKHRLHLVICTLNQMFRAILNSPMQGYMQNFTKCLSMMSQLRDVFVLLIRSYQPQEQSTLYLRDMVQTNHVLMIMMEEWLTKGFIGSHSGFSMLNHVNQFATKGVMQNYGSLLSGLDLSEDTINVAVMTMMYHVAGDCKHQDTLMQLPILKSFYEIWVNNAMKGEEEFQDLIKFVLEAFMSDAENNPNSCAADLFENGEQSVRDEGLGEEVQGNERSEGSGSMNGDSAMTVGSTSSEEDFGDEEEALIFSWVTELNNSTKTLPDIITERLQANGYIKNRTQVMKYLVVNGLIEDNTVSSSTDTSTSKSGQEVSAQKDSLASQLSSLTENNAMSFLLDNLRSRGFEPQLQWLQNQLLETAYVKLAITDSRYRVHVEEPVPKFFALQNKPVPIIPWNEELETALADPGFYMLQQNLGLFTPQDGNLLYTRIPQYMSPSLLVSKARQIGPIESLIIKFDVNTLKDSGDEDMRPEVSQKGYKNMTCPPSQAKVQDHDWIRMIHKTNNMTKAFCNRS